MNKKIFIIVLFIINFFYYTAVSADQTDQRLDTLFLNIKDSPNELVSSVHIARIWKIWGETNEAYSQSLYNLGDKLLKQKQYEQSLVVFSKLILDKPNFAEGWNKRATLYFLMGNFNKSILDINKTLTLEPRHFGALDGLGQIQFKLNNFQGSIEAYEELLQIIPHSSNAKKMLKLMNAQFI